MKTLLLDTAFKHGNADHFEFTSLVSLYDYDLVIWDPEGTSGRYEGAYRPEYRGRPSPTEAESVALAEALERRKREFAEFIALGRTLILIASPEQLIWLDTGRQQTSGTGRNQKVTRLVSDINLLDAFPFPYKATAGRGVELEPVAVEVDDLWRETKGEWMYRCALEEYPGTATLKIAGADKVVGSLLVTESGGVVAVLPEPAGSTDDDLPEDNQSSWAWRYPADDDDSSTFSEAAQSMQRWATRLSVTDGEQLPAWATDFRFDTELQRAIDLTKLEKSLARLTGRIEQLKAKQAEDEKWKRLVYSQGATLETQAKAAFELLGFTVLEASRGRSDLRLEYQNQRVVVEVKGVGKSAAEKNAAQLEKWVAEELTDGVVAKGILLVNGWRSTQLNQRPPAFPSQMLPYAIARGHCLLTGMQLLGMCRAVLSGAGSGEELAQRLVHTVGTFEGFENPDETFQPPPTVEELRD